MKRSITWWQGAVMMSLLLLFTFSIFGANRPLGSSTSISYVSSLLLGMQEYEYTQKVLNSGAWELVMLLGAFTGGLISALFITKTFKFEVIPPLWREAKNNSKVSRLLWSFIGGFLVILGARIAGGCTSGHFLSGISQTALSGLIFGGTVIVALLATGRLFYNRGQNV